MDDKKEYPKPPDGIRVLSNGAGFDLKRKRIAYGPGTFAPDTGAITKENSLEFHHKRYEKSRLITEQALASAQNVSDVWGGWYTIMMAQIALAQDTKQGRASTEAAKFVGRAADLLPNQARNTPTNQTNVQINVDRTALLDVLSQVSGQIIDID